MHHPGHNDAQTLLRRQRKKRDLILFPSIQWPMDHVIKLRVTFFELVPALYPSWSAAPCWPDVSLLCSINLHPPQSKPLLPPPRRLSHPCAVGIRFHVYPKSCYLSFRIEVTVTHIVRWIHSLLIQSPWFELCAKWQFLLFLIEKSRCNR